MSFMSLKTSCKENMLFIFKDLIMSLATDCNKHPHQETSKEIYDGCCDSGGDRGDGPRRARGG